MSTTIFEKQGSNLTVRPKGRLDTATSPVLEQELQQYLDGVQYVTMDFTEVEYITSGGLRVLLATDQILEDRGGNLRVIHVNEHILEVFQLVGFMEIVDVEES
ncbi:MAG: STAS domain-containing protein [Oscillospiraceae bacterium]|nr:STAS domain-containing protein [Oscillospiraceae bacterium]MBO7423432.1 STAS domain-containing protein [Oscillospiraceae bacterium]MBP5169466.1 STAS domain-containing protein [Oscillospiraceae bacterium]